MLQHFETILPLLESLWSSDKIRYILWVVALLEVCDVTNNGRHLGFYQELEIRFKPLEIVNFRALHELCMILASRFTFIVERSWKNMYFHPKMVWPPVAYDVISRDHSNWPSLNVTQKVRERWTNSFWKRQVLMFFVRPRVKMNSWFFKLWRVYSSSLKKSNEGGFSWGWLSSWGLHTRLVTV